MKKIFFLLLPVILAVIVFVTLNFIFQKSNVEKGALQITSTPQSRVFLNGQEVGKTPFCRCGAQDMLPVGDYSVKLLPVVSGYDQYEEKINVSHSLLTVIDREFGDVGKSSGIVISLSQINDTHNAQVFVSTFPYGANVSLDSNPSGTAPVTLNHVTESDHSLIVSKTGYKDKSINIHAVMGYKLNAVVSLATDIAPAEIPTSTPSATPVVSGSPTPSVSPTSVLQGPQITILDTPTGFLRVRDNPSLGGNEISQVHPGEVYALVSEQEGWYEIKLKTGMMGWVSSAYAKKQ